ncbi:MAG TPA: UDP-N-acetylmuramoylalanyl-D-glutamyl-2,6-diaminopimelate--D-alanyl-D-alanine ligase [Rhizomicrobium sp.]|nr:UDP-N-acetylmuramoylalanyl-D-glutamyl-2,6-diaminopimelate--D-alanyl-D-alanine ligase [Rhizomicrobium sp.]
MTALWTSEEAQGATLAIPGRAFEVFGLSIDTRTLKPGDLFVALRGENRDGHDFVKAAFNAKAGAALVSREPAGLPAGAALLTVANTQRGLEDLACAARARSAAKIVGVTGSAGKTTTKELLRLALGALGTTHCSAASYNNHWGVPLSLAALPRDAKYGVFEIGMNHFGEIRSLVGFVQPHVALITTIAPAHLEFFGSCEAIADAKSEIFEGLVPGGAAILPADNPYVDRLAARARQSHVSRVLMFGEKAGSDARLVAYAESGDGAQVKADICGTPVDFRLGAPGRHIAGNAIAALLTVSLLDGDVLNAAAAMRDFAALKGRGARFAAAGVSVIDESYNANPASMAAALALLGAATGRRIAVLGDMLEMGADGASHHAALAQPIEVARADSVFLCGTQMKTLWDALPAPRRGAWAQTSAELAPQLSAALKSGDTVLVKGSLGSKMSVIVDALKARVA